MAKKLETVTDVETARQVFVARSLYWGDRAGYGNDTRAALRKSGLEAYIEARRDTYTVKLDRLLAELGQTFEVRPERPHTPRDGSWVEDAFYEKAREFRRSLTPDDYVKKEPSDKIVNVEAVTAAFGRSGALPPTEGDEPEATWRELVKSVLAWADDRGMCGVVEDGITAAGFGDFIPAREAVMDVTWRGVTLQGVTVALKRDGSVDQNNLYRVIHQELRNEVDKIETRVAAAATAA